MYGWDFHGETFVPKFEFEPLEASI